MNGDIVAQRYAKALFALGQQEGMAKLEQYGENLSALEGVLEDSPELVRLFHIPVISVAEKQKVLSQVLDKLDVDPMIKNFCSLLAEKERLPLFEEIAEAFGKLLDEAWGVVRGKLLTAVSLSKEQQAGILARLEKQTSKQIDPGSRNSQWRSSRASMGYGPASANALSAVTITRDSLARGVISTARLWTSPSTNPTSSRPCSTWRTISAVFPDSHSIST